MVALHMHHPPPSRTAWISLQSSIQVPCQALPSLTAARAGDQCYIERCDCVLAGVRSEEERERSSSPAAVIMSETALPRGPFHAGHEYRGASGTQEPVTCPHLISPTREGYKAFSRHATCRFNSGKKQTLSFNSAHSPPSDEMLHMTWREQDPCKSSLRESKFTCRDMRLVPFFHQNCLKPFFAVPDAPPCEQGLEFGHEPVRPDEADHRDSHHPLGQPLIYRTTRLTGWKCSHRSLSPS